MMLSELPYPQRLVVEMLHYSTWACEKTQNMKCSEILKALGVFFTEDQLSEAKAILEGKAPNAELTGRQRLHGAAGNGQE